MKGRLRIAGGKDIVPGDVGVWADFRRGRSTGAPNTGFVEKGLSVAVVGKQIISYLKKNLSDISVDLLVLTVPPVTYDDVIKYAKRKYKCKVYLLLKDFWPASLFDVDVKGGNLVKKAACSYLRLHEKSLFNNSDYIGCMSEGNVRYLLDHNDYVSPSKVHVNPNVITVKDYKEKIGRAHV